MLNLEYFEALRELRIAKAQFNCAEPGYAQAANARLTAAEERLRAAIRQAREARA